MKNWKTRRIKYIYDDVKGHEVDSVSLEFKQFLATIIASQGGVFRLARYYDAVTVHLDPLDWTCLSRKDNKVNQNRTDTSIY